MASPSISTSSPTTNANDLVIGVFSVANSAAASWTVGSGFANFVSVAGNGSANNICAECQVVSSTGTQTATIASQITGKSFIDIVIALIGAAAPPPAGPAGNLLTMGVG